MTTPKRPGAPSATASDESKARIFLAVACLWPLFVLALFAASAPQLKEARQHPRELLDKNNKINQDVRFKFRKVLDRVDVMGYGPTHPRVAVVIVGENNEKIISSVESLFRHTSLERIFAVVVCVEGRESDSALLEELEKIDNGAVPHWHGLRADIHLPGESDAEDKADHGSRIQVLFNNEKLGISESRSEAVEYIHLLSQQHESTGIKSPQEDLLLLLLQSGAQFVENHDWLAPVTGALIVPPPLIASANKQSPFGAMKLANAVAFNTEGSGKRTSFDLTFAPIISDASATDINLSDGKSYPTPVWNGAAIAMRLNTYRFLPAQDASLTEEWPANLELSLNLWLCADGMDMIRDVEIVNSELMPHNPLSPEMMARFAAAWMDDVTANQIYHEYSKTFHELTHLEWETLLSKARGSTDFPIDLTERCRSFAWYARHVNTDITEAIVTAAKEVAREDEERKAEMKIKLEEAKKVAMEEAARKAEAAAAEAKQAAEDAEAAQKAAVAEKAAQDEAAKKEAEEAAAKKDGEQPDANKDGEQPDADKDGEQPDANINEENAMPDMAHGEEPKKPAKPLRENNLEIISQAKPVDIKFVDISDGHKEHPHMGALDEDGNPGYIHDETALRLNPPPFSFSGPKFEMGCKLRDNNYRMLTEKVKLDIEGHKAAEDSGKKRDKIFCLVYTIEKFHDRIPAIRETWGPHCDGFMVGSTKTDKSLGTVEIPHEGPEEYNNIWQKVRSMWSYIYDNYYEKYDWFHIGGDDLFLILENLRLYLESEEIRTAANGGINLPNGDETMQTPLFLGRRFSYMGDMNDIFISGGSGYTMNKASLKLLVTEAFPNYFPHAHTFSEDTMVAKLLRKLNVFPYDTKDDNGGERYMPFMPGHHYGYKLPPGNPMDSQDWYAKYSINIKEGKDHCAEQSVAFHYVKGNDMYRLYAMIYGKCPAGTYP
ncbi:acetylgalactosamine 3-beta-galactosyltransferase 1 [Seminavis robusta]|uniref:Acetylgalactosamine 3-beta-galactosyltransferase 1 n=1 Tax=Seminavis robusta TaxID=568900 RepID=A0A9N8H3I2_9STRA|nr:acetylgalactosamine 3-beta-galactosyltransferase 1 [Seminavis robusta]|eukprot:Sro88_g046380.1 acetylgalactosamine 3-beta-galactosyltransferase 1 (944) ;mRNA; r:27645-30739